MRIHALVAVALLPVGCAVAPELDSGVHAFGSDVAPDDGPLDVSTVDPARGADLVENLPCAWELEHDHSNGADTGGEHRPHLAIGWCMAISPEDDEHDHDHGDTGVADLDEPDPGEVGAESSDAPDDAPPPPCTFENLTGGLRLGGTAGDPLLTYCDGDTDGGTRTVSRVSTSKSFHRIVAPGACLPAMDSADLVDTDAGVRLYYLASDAHAGPTLTSLDLTDRGRPVAESAVATLAGRTVVANSVVVVPLHGASPRTVVETTDGELVVAGADTWQVLADGGIQRLTAAAVGDGVAVAACHDDGRVGLWQVPADGRAGPEWTIDALACDGLSRPQLASDGQRAVLALADAASGGSLLLLDDGGVTRRVELGPDAGAPAVAWDGARWLTVDTSGRVAAWSPELDLLGSGEHPGVVDVVGEVDAFRLLADETGLTIAVLGHADRPTFPGHHATYDWIELSHLGTEQLLGR